MNTVPDSRIMLYAGDVDMACNFLGGEMFADALNLPVRSPYSYGNKSQATSQTEPVYRKKA